MYRAMKPFTAVPFDVAFREIWAYEKDLSLLIECGAQYLGTSQQDIQYAFLADAFAIYQQRFTSLEMVLLQMKAESFGLYFPHLPSVSRSKTLHHHIH